MTNPTLFCPIRGQLKIKTKSADGLVFTEEKRRIDCIKYLLKKGYPKAHFKIETTLLHFGHKGKNSFRTDLVVFDVPAPHAETLDEDEQRGHILIAAEIKRDHDDASTAKATQVKPALSFLPDTKSLGIYWDDIEQRLFYREIVNKTKTQIVEAALTYLPDYGASLSISKLRYNDLQTADNLTALFRKIEDCLHHHCADKDLRYQAMLQLILCKIFDEKLNKEKNGVLGIQDFSLFSLDASAVVSQFNTLLDRSLGVYQHYLPKKVSNKFSLKGDALKEVCKHLAPVNLGGSSPTAIQEF